MSTPYAVFDDFLARIAEIRELERSGQAGLRVFCEKLARPENLALYFPMEADRAVIEDRRRACCYDFWMFALLSALGLRPECRIRAVYTCLDTLFWRQEELPDAVFQVFCALFESLAAMGYIAHFLEIYNILAVEARLGRLSKAAREKILGKESPLRRLKDRIATDYCRVSTGADGQLEVSWTHSSPFGQLEPRPLSELTNQKVASQTYSLRAKSITARLCKHGLLLVPNVDSTRLTCGMPAKVRCDVSDAI